MLPIGLEVTSQPLLFCPQQYLDFGVVDANDPPKTLKLFVINSGNRPITVQVYFVKNLQNRQFLFLNGTLSSFQLEII